MPKRSEDPLLLDNQLCVPLYVASRLVTQAYRAHLEPHGLTYPQYIVLMVLWETDGVSLQEIGGRLSLDSGTLTPVLKRMVVAKLITQRRDARDRRVVHTFLTAKGRRLRAKVTHVPVDLLCEVGLTMTEVTQLKQRLSSLIGKLERHATHLSER
jgi:DNA-binding MarR family transcriptional regulator